MPKTKLPYKIFFDNVKTGPILTMPKPAVEIQKLAVEIKFLSLEEGQTQHGQTKLINLL